MSHQNRAEFFFLSGFYTHQSTSTIFVWAHICMAGLSKWGKKRWWWLVECERKWKLCSVFTHYNHFGTQNSIQFVCFEAPSIAKICMRDVRMRVYVYTYASGQDKAIHFRECGKKSSGPTIVNITWILCVVLCCVVWGVREFAWAIDSFFSTLFFHLLSFCLVESSTMTKSSNVFWHLLKKSQNRPNRWLWWLFNTLSKAAIHFE